jgi:sec-independent protein translocase protein TatA
MAELLVVLFILVLVFGSSKIPAIGDGLGRAVRNFRKALGQDEKKP